MHNFIVRGYSMIGELEPDDEVSVNTQIKITRNALIVFRYGDDSRIKKCYGLPCDHIAVEEDQIFINHKAVPLKLGNEGQISCWKDWTSENIIPHGHIFVLGTMHDSLDSRRLGFLDMKYVIGVAEKVNK